MEIYVRPGVRLRLKVRLLKADVIETLLYGCMTWSSNKSDYDRLRRVHHSMLLRCIGWRKQKRDGYTLSYADALAKAGSESVEAIVRKRRIFTKNKFKDVSREFDEFQVNTHLRKLRLLFSGFVARLGEGRLPQGVMYGELVGGKGCSGG